MTGGEFTSVVYEESLDEFHASSVLTLALARGPKEETERFAAPAEYTRSSIGAALAALREHWSEQRYFEN